MFSRMTIDAVTAVATTSRIAPAALLAVAEIESAGRAFTLIGDRREPVIRFEGHYFDRRLSGAARTAAREQGLASPLAGAVHNPATQAARWRLLARAEAIDRRAARESTSWGIGQVMGAHWAWLGYADVDALVAEARGDVAGQARLMVRYIEKAGLADALRRHDWRSFARGYNGPAYEEDAYHTRLERAFLRHDYGKAAADHDTTTLKRGIRGTAVGALQRLLCAHGYAVATDGVFGPATTRAVEGFQREHGLIVDGVVGPTTRAALENVPAQRVGRRIWQRMRAWFGFAMDDE